MNIITFGSMLADFESRLQNLETMLQASIEAVNLERNAMLNAIDEAANKQLDDLNKYVDAVRMLRGAEPNYPAGTIVELRHNNK